MFVKNPPNKLSMLTMLLLFVGLIGVALLSPAVSGASGAVPLRADGELLQERALRFMLEINAARRDPLAIAERLGVNEQLVRDVFADDPTILKQGLPPLAWNRNLAVSSAAHGRDMFDRLYYDYVTPEGKTVEQRILSTGYQSLDSGETMNALFFENYVGLDDAFKLLVDAMIRDELTGSSVERNIFSSDLTELGVTFFAESIPLLEEQPYVYLLVADFAAPVVPRQFVVVKYDENSRLIMRTAAEDRWLYPEVLSSGLAQFPCPGETTELVVVDKNGLGVVSRTFVLQLVWDEQNTYIDLLALSGEQGDF